MTKREAIDALEASELPDDTELLDATNESALVGIHSSEDGIITLIFADEEDYDGNEFDEFDGLPWDL